MALATETPRALLHIRDAESAQDRFRLLNLFVQPDGSTGATPLTPDLLQPAATHFGGTQTVSLNRSGNRAAIVRAPYTVTTDEVVCLVVQVYDIIVGDFNQVQWVEVGQDVSMPDELCIQHQHRVLLSPDQ